MATSGQISRDQVLVQLVREKEESPPRTARVTILPGAGELAGFKITAELHLNPTTRRAEHGPVQITPPDGVPFGELPASTYRRLGLSAALNEVEVQLRRLDLNGVIEGWGWVDALALGKRPGRRGQDPMVYATWALRYVDALERAPKSPTAQLIADDAARGIHRTEGEVRHYLGEARRRGLLKPRNAPRGRAAGELTARARRLLSIEER